MCIIQVVHDERYHRTLRFIVQIFLANKGSVSYMPPVSACGQGANEFHRHVEYDVCIGKERRYFSHPNQFKYPLQSP
jgi:hypothetical protein